MNEPIKKRPPGMKLNQLIAMLMAAQAQGAEYVMVGVQSSPDQKECSGVDWVGMSPVAEPHGKTVYIGTMDDWDYMSNEALQSIDW